MACKILRTLVSEFDDESDSFLKLAEYEINKIKFLSKNAISFLIV